jgi:diguanylate cyclase (GGDEF)-like protein
VGERKKQPSKKMPAQVKNDVNKPCLDTMPVRHHVQRSQTQRVKIPDHHNAFIQELLQEKQPFHTLEAFELQCARGFALPLPEAVEAALETLGLLTASLLGESTGVKSALILLASASDTGIQSQRTPAHHPSEDYQAPPATTAFFDRPLSAEKRFFGSKFKQTVEHPIKVGNQVMGSLLVGCTPTVSTLDNKVLLFEKLVILTQYLAPHVVSLNHFQQEKSQNTLLETYANIASAFVTAADQNGIVSALLTQLCTKSSQNMFFLANPLSDWLVGPLKGISLLASVSERKTLEEVSLPEARSVLVHHLLETPLNTSQVALLGTRVAVCPPWLWQLLAVFEPFETTCADTVMLFPASVPGHSEPLGWVGLAWQKKLPLSLSVATTTMILRLCTLMAQALVRMTSFKQVETLAQTDSLTGLLNRRGFYDCFESELERCRRNPTPLCLAMVDVDHFKVLNDAYGHLVGDDVLQALATLLQNNVRRSDIVCRFGGEEFALLLPQATLQDGYELMERIRGLLYEAHLLPQRPDIRVSISAGVSAIPDEWLHVKRRSGKKSLGAMSSKQILENALHLADKNLYLAKQSGRNQVKA